jgi:hypothetical protein
LHVSNVLKLREKVHFIYLCVLCLFVAAQVNLALEGPAAEVAGEGLVAGVLPRVRDEVAAL